MIKNKYQISVVFVILCSLLFNLAPVYGDEKILSEIIAPSAVLIDGDSGVVIYNKNMNERMYPASITKLMTVLLTLEYAEGNFDERITMSNNAVFSLPYGSSHIAMDEGETLSIEEALYGVLLASANEVSNALAEHIAGSTEAFALMMTNRAVELGAKDTQFKNPHGLHEEDHYTTAYDMALIMKELIQYPQFVKTISTTFYAVPPTEKQPEERPLYNSHKMVQPVNQHYDETVVGGKTGFTDEAGHTLVTYARKGAHNLIAVVLKDEKAGAYTDTKALLDYGFEQFHWVDILNPLEYSGSIPVVNPGVNQPEQLKLILDTNEKIRLNLPLSVEESKLKQEISFDVTQVTENVSKGQVMGSLEVTFEDVTLAKANIIAAEDVLVAVVPGAEEAQKEEEYFGDVLLGIKVLAVLFGGLLFLVLTISILRERSRRKRRRYRRYRSAAFKPPARQYRYRS